MSQTPDRLRGYLSRYAEEYPGAWKMFEKIREGRGKDLPDWPSWCWCPLSGAYSIVSMLLSREDGKVPIERIPDVGSLGALAAWRMTQGIYQVDPDLFAALWTTPLTGSLPVELLYRIPEWCVYIEVPKGYELNNQPLYGWFAHLEYDVNSGRSELRFVFDFEEGPASYMLHLSANTLKECIAETAEEGKRQALIHGQDKNIKELAKAMEISEKEEKESIERQDIVLSPFISVILYLCSVAADIADSRGKRERPGNPLPKKTKKGMRVFPATGNTTWLVGYRVGATLRKGAGGEYAEAGAGVGTRPSTHASPRPHIRRAHWHSYWTGPRKEPAKRRLMVKWIHPVLVGAEGIVPTIRRVE